jgi:hypothetical protein
MHCSCLTFIAGLPKPIMYVVVTKHLTTQVPAIRLQIALLGEGMLDTGKAEILIQTGCWAGCIKAPHRAILHSGLPRPRMGSDCWFERTFYRSYQWGYDQVR